MKYFLTSVFLVLLVIGLALLFAFPTKWLVNYLFSPGLLTHVFGASHINVYQALGLNVLTGILFGRGGKSS